MVHSVNLKGAADLRRAFCNHLLTWDFWFFSTSKPKDNASSATPPPVRNGGQVNAAPNQSASSSNQLSVNQPQNAAGPSPHSVRRGMIFCFCLAFKALSSNCSLSATKMLAKITLPSCLPLLQTSVLLPFTRTCIYLWIPSWVLLVMLSTLFNEVTWLLISKPIFAFL